MLGLPASPLGEQLGATWFLYLVGIWTNCTISSFSLPVKVKHINKWKWKWGQYRMLWMCCALYGPGSVVRWESSESLDVRERKSLRYFPSYQLPSTDSVQSMESGPRTSSGTTVERMPISPLTDSSHLYHVLKWPWMVLARLGKERGRIQPRCGSQGCLVRAV